MTIDTLAPLLCCDLTPDQREQLVSGRVPGSTDYDHLVAPPQHLCWAIERLEVKDSSLFTLDASLRLLPCATHIELTGNRIVQIANLDCCQSLLQLDLGMNHITSIPNLKGHVGNLKALGLRANKITELGGLIDLKSLNALDLSANLIASRDVLEKLRNLPVLSELWLNDNPVSLASGYRRALLRIIGPEILQQGRDGANSFKLDGKRVSAEETARAKSDDHHYMKENGLLQTVNASAERVAALRRALSSASPIASPFAPFGSVRPLPRSLPFPTPGRRGHVVPKTLRARVEAGMSEVVASTLEPPPEYPHRRHRPAVVSLHPAHSDNPMRSMHLEDIRSRMSNNLEMFKLQVRGRATAAGLSHALLTEPPAGPEELPAPGVYGTASIPVMSLDDVLPPLMLLELTPKVACGYLQALGNVLLYNLAGDAAVVQLYNLQLDILRAAGHIHSEAQVAAAAIDQRVTHRKTLEEASRAQRERTERVKNEDAPPDAVSELLLMMDNHKLFDVHIHRKAAAPKKLQSLDSLRGSSRGRDDDLSSIMPHTPCEMLDSSEDDLSMDFGNFGEDDVEEDISQNPPKPDSSRLVRRIDVAVPREVDGSLAVFSQSLEVDGERGIMVEYDEDDAVVSRYNLNQLVTFLFPQNYHISSTIYKCIVLLFNENAKVAEETSTPSGQSKKPAATDGASGEGAGVIDYDDEDTASSSDDDDQTVESMNYNELLSMFPVERIYRMELDVPLPGVDDDSMRMMVAGSIQSSTKGSYDPLRASHSLLVRQTALPPQYKVAVYFMGPGKHLNEARVGPNNYVDLLELIGKPLKDQLVANPSIPSYWALCLRCSRSYRAFRVGGGQVHCPHCHYASSFTTGDLSASLLQRVRLIPGTEWKGVSSEKLQWETKAYKRYVPLPQALLPSVPSVWGSSSASAIIKSDPPPYRPSTDEAKEAMDSWVVHRPATLPWLTSHSGIQLLASTKDSIIRSILKDALDVSGPPMPCLRYIAAVAQQQGGVDSRQIDSSAVPLAAAPAAAVMSPAAPSATDKGKASHTGTGGVDDDDDESDDPFGLDDLSDDADAADADADADDVDTAADIFAHSLDTIRPASEFQVEHDPRSFRGECQSILIPAKHAGRFRGFSRLSADWVDYNDKTRLAALVDLLFSGFGDSAVDPHDVLGFWLMGYSDYNTTDTILNYVGILLTKKTLWKVMGFDERTHTIGAITEEGLKMGTVNPMPKMVDFEVIHALRHRLSGQQVIIEFDSHSDHTIRPAILYPRDPEAALEFIHRLRLAYHEFTSQTLPIFDDSHNFSAKILPIIPSLSTAVLERHWTDSMGHRHQINWDTEQVLGCFHAFASTTVDLNPTKITSLVVTTERIALVVVSALFPILSVGSGIVILEGFKLEKTLENTVRPLSLIDAIEIPVDSESRFDITFKACGLNAPFPRLKLHAIDWRHRAVLVLNLSELLRQHLRNGVIVQYKQ
eukprot:gnl/Dysnectes_brevis/3937_a5130_391.p1 GENE.gnl/Dysnectes_brevis/3937_a5130_391~~gnl/Dysnectes_brevis/3937_a5130_391.p1  ORF type:complete len:1551 (-),score=260.81 gnl/Dysnectes_brevis/3937_a5130_391:1996-6387(-)